MSKVIEAVQRPTLVISHNKTLAAQLYGEFKGFFPNNAVEYFISYYYYYQLYTDVGGIHFSPIADEASTYEILARQILSGNGLSHELFSYRPPLQPMFIALTYLVSGSTNPLIAVFVQSFISTGLAIITFVIAKELNMSKPVQFFSGLIVALDPASIIIGMTLMS